MDGQTYEGVRASLPGNVDVFKVPHHGSVNGTFDAGKQIVWQPCLAPGARLGISSHTQPFGHPMTRW